MCVCACVSQNSTNDMTNHQPLAVTSSLHLAHQTFSTWPICRKANSKNLQTQKRQILFVFRFDIWDVKHFNIFIVISIFCSFFIFTFRKLCIYQGDALVAPKKHSPRKKNHLAKSECTHFRGDSAGWPVKGQAFTFQSFARFWWYRWMVQKSGDDQFIW